ncbi:MAG TPA: CpXC domain-containing protein [Anaerolineae bacterium]|nr:CpXC domain-containing protein [Anaerolineae bacterium]
MTASNYQNVPVTCPNCRTRFGTPVLTIVDAAQDPQARSMFLSGQLNVAVCPNCGHAGVLGTPIVYHDPEKELLLTYVPTELSLPEVEQQRVVGDLTNRVMTSMPPEQRKGYLLRPRNFIRLESMIEAVLEAEGVTREMMDAQRARVALLERLLRTPSEDARRTIVQENDSQIDYEFLQLLTLNLQMAQQQGQDQAVQQLHALRQELLQWTAAGQEVAARQEAIRELGDQVTREELLAKLVAAAEAGQEAKVETMVAVARPLVDYIFYQQLTERIEAAEQAGEQERARALTGLRQAVLELTAELDAEMEELAAEAMALLEQIVESEDVEQALLANLPRIDQLFMELLADQMRTAEARGDAARTEKLRRVGDSLMAIVEESQPPQVLLINHLLTAEYPEGTRALLQENRATVDQEFLELMEMIAQDLAREGRHELAERLEQIRQQAGALAA